MPFEWTEVLAALLGPFNDVQIVIHSSWREHIPAQELRDLLEPLADRLLGAVEAGNKGAVVGAEFSVATPKTYTFYLNLYFREGDRGDRVPVGKINLTQQELKSLEQDRQNMERVRKLAGTAGAYRDGRQIDTGLAIPVRLRVERIDNNGASPVLERVFTNHDREGMAADYFSKIITRIRLEPGRYRARVEALESIRELEGISVHFNMVVGGRN